MWLFHLLGANFELQLGNKTKKYLLRALGKVFCCLFCYWCFSSSLKGTAVGGAQNQLFCTAGFSDSVSGDAGDLPRSSCMLSTDSTTEPQPKHNGFLLCVCLFFFPFNWPHTVCLSLTHLPPCTFTSISPVLKATVLRKMPTGKKN
jgi:hypothetical protein